MTQSVMHQLFPEPAGSPQARPQPRTVLSLHGADPLTHVPVTWHVTSLAEDGARGTYLVERAEGDIHSPAVWMQAQRVAATVGEAEVLELVGTIMFAGGPSLVGDQGLAGGPGPVGGQDGGVVRGGRVE